MLDDYVFRTVDTAGMKSLLDTQAGRLSSLADNEDFLLLAEAMDSMSAYSIFLTDNVAVWQENNQTVLQSHLLHPYNALATGVGRDEQGFFMAVALLYDSLEDAEDDIAILERKIQEDDDSYLELPWNTRISATEFRTEGRALLGKLRVRDTQLWSNIILNRNNLFAYR